MSFCQQHSSGTAGNDRSILPDFNSRLISSGAVNICLVALRSYALVKDPAHACSSLVCAPSVLQMMSLAPEWGTKLLKYAASKGLSADVLQVALMDMVERGGQTRKWCEMFATDVRAAMAVGLLFGREEDEEGANTVPVSTHASAPQLELQGQF